MEEYFQLLEETKYLRIYTHVLHRWGYVALLGVTMGLGILLNLVYLAGYHACPRAMLEVPHVAIVSLALRDLLICVLVIPAALDWLIAGLTSWPGGEAW